MKKCSSVALERIKLAPGSSVNPGCEVIEGSLTINGNETHAPFFVHVGDKNMLVLIKKNQLAKEIENQRTSRFARGDKVDAMIAELDKEKRKVTLSIKALEEEQRKEAVKKYGSTDSGALLGEILGPLLQKKNKK